jgi:DNA-binding transcriptional MocR family regulator
MSDPQLSARALEALLGQWRTAGPTYLALTERIRLLALDGRIPIDTRLPAERDLAVRLGLSRTTITAAYRALRDAGFLESQRGSGSAIRLLGRAPIAMPTTSEGLLDFSKAAVPATVLLHDAARAATEELPRFLADSGYDPVGLPELREAIAARYTTRGIPTSADQILVTVGALQAIALVARTLLTRGDRVLIETPSYPHAVEAMRSAGARIVATTVAADFRDQSPGWDLDGLTQSVQRTSPSLGYFMPDFHNPTGASMPEQVREGLIAVAASQGTILIVDETTAELDIDRVETFSPLPAYAATPREAASIILLGSAGKTLWGGLRVGWIRAERPLIRKLVAAKPTSDLGTPILEQLITAQLVPQLDAIVEERRAQLRRGRDGLESALASRFPDWDFPRIDGGLAAWVRLDAPHSSQLALAARNFGLLIAAGPRFGVDGPFERFLRIPITYGDAETAQAVEALASASETLLRHPVPDSGYLADVV